PTSRGCSPNTRGCRWWGAGGTRGGRLVDGFDFERRWAQVRTGEPRRARLVPGGWTSGQLALTGPTWIDLRPSGRTCAETGPVPSSRAHHAGRSPRYNRPTLGSASSSAPVPV